MRKLIPTLVTAAMLSSAASADVLGVYAGTGNWKPDFSGNISNQSQDSITFGSDGVDVREKNQTGFYIAFEHPVPLLPNAMLKEQDLKSNGSGTFNGSFGGNTFSGNVDTEFDLSHRDYVLYYEILDNWVNLDLGLTARQFDASATVTDSNNANNTTTEELDGTIPMLYGKARFDLPLTGLSFSVILNHISASGNSLTDSSMVVGYESSFGLGVEGGIRTFSLELDGEDGFDSDMEFDGVFINATYHF